MSDTIEQKCISKGVKLTDQRRIIAKVMSEASDHPDVDELYNRVSKIDPKIETLLPQLFCVDRLILHLLIYIFVQ